ncbi:hypothetical protein BDZ94DRAFT_1257779 [Collybia nuda]|uniref:DUF7918 domain-containing protein n=1 Tax=Collybia nuda TaxID=64659 RepID=A0A9P6CKJ8_9AGAR|nr:hypothetical protein BDZ94DRAFT_1257779 [Collybia nuda]
MPWARRVCFYITSKMPSFGTFKACISVEGTTLHEYSVTTNEQSNTITCWIPSEVGKKFSVKIGTTAPHSTLLLCDLSIDGNFLRRASLINRVDGMSTITSVATSATTYRHLVFSSVELTDDDAFLDTANVKDLGDISLKIFEVLQFHQTETFLPEGLRVPDGKVHERSKKITGHRVGLGPEKSRNPCRRMFVAEKVGSVLVTFLFKYRPIDILRADGIAPTGSSTPQKLTGKRKVEDDEDKKLVREIPGGGEQPPLLKGGTYPTQMRLPTAISSVSPKKRVKIEYHHSIPSREVIDLT